MYDIRRDLWNPVDRMNRGKAWIQCGVARRTREDGTRATEVVVVGGGTANSNLDEVEIFDVESGTWTLVEDFPIYIKKGRAAPYRDSFIIVGGYDDYYDHYLPAIWEYLPEKRKFQLLGHSLRVPRYDQVVIPVPDYIGNCYDQ